MVLLGLVVAQGLHTVPDLLTGLGVPDPVWDAFTATAGDPGNRGFLAFALRRTVDTHPGGSSGAGVAQCKMDSTPTWRREP